MLAFTGTIHCLAGVSSSSMVRRRCEFIPHFESLIEIYPYICTAPGTQEMLKYLFTIRFTHISRPLDCSHLSLLTDMEGWNRSQFLSYS